MRWISTGKPDRKIERNVIISDHDPRIRITLPSAVQYAGSDRWNLYDVADCELHAFVEADSSKHVHKLFWIQFEGYLPSHADAHYDYNSPRHTTIGGLDFYLDTWVRGSEAATRAGSRWTRRGAAGRRRARSS